MGRYFRCRPEANRQKNFNDVTLLSHCGPTWLTENDFILVCGCIRFWFFALTLTPHVARKDEMPAVESI